nr:ShlB/FhaC/HecB family hemolysin secretion/activation protein [uncultured Desulfobacter sp.]
MCNLLQKSVPIAALLTFLLYFSALAGPPDAGQILKEQRPPQKLPNRLPAPKDMEKSPEKTEDGIQVHIRGFTFSGYQGLISERELQSLVAGAVGKDLSFNQLQALVADVTRHLKAQGYFLARAYLPRQDVSAGIIQIVIRQGKNDGSLKIMDDGSLRIHKHVLEKIGKQTVKAGEALKSQDLERAMLLMNDLPGISAKASLIAGSKPDTTAVEVKAGEGSLLDGALWADNYGNRYTGTWRGNTMLNINDPLHIGDKFSFLATGAEDLYLGELDYSLPLTAGGLRAAISYTGLKYKLGKELSFLDAEGEAHTINAGVSYPWLRSRKANITGTLNYEFRRLTDSASGIDLHNKDIHSTILGVNGNYYDGFNGGGLTTWNVALIGGHLDEKTADITITDTEGCYAHLNAGLARLQRLTKGVTANLSWRGQFSFNNLDSSEQFSLGGVYGIRAYPMSEGLGDEGHLFTLQIDYDVPLPPRYGRLRANIFYDAGHVTLHKSPWTNAISTATDKNRYWLQGAGLGFSYAYNEIFNVTTCWAHTIGNNDGRSSTGENTDGKKDSNRFWIQAVWNF